MGVPRKAASRHTRSASVAGVVRGSSDVEEVAAESPLASDEFELKKYEELYSLTKSEFERAHSRFGAIEEKTGRHFSLLVVTLGVVSIGLSEYVKVLRGFMTFWHYVFAVVYPVLVITVMVAVWFYARAIAFGRYKNIVLDNEMLAFFRGNRYVDVIYAMSKRFADDTRILNELNNQKVSHAARAFVVTRIALLVMALLLLLLVLIKLQ